MCWSEYKHDYTIKFLLGLGPLGAADFVSEAYPGSITDAESVEVSGLLDMLMPDDVVGADKGFLIGDALAKVGARMRAPPRKLTKQDQFAWDQADETAAQARVRVHVERLIARIKNFGFLQRRIALTHMHIVSDIFYVIAQFVAIQGPPVGPSQFEGAE